MAALSQVRQQQHSHSQSIMCTHLGQMLGMHSSDSSLQPHSAPRPPAVRRDHQRDSAGSFGPDVVSQRGGASIDGRHAHRLRLERVPVRSCLAVQRCPAERRVGGLPEGEVQAASCGLLVSCGMGRRLTEGLHALGSCPPTRQNQPERAD